MHPLRNAAVVLQLQDDPFGRNRYLLLGDRQAAIRVIALADDLAVERNAEAFGGVRHIGFALVTHISRALQANLFAAIAELVESTNRGFVGRKQIRRLQPAPPSSFSAARLLTIVRSL